MRDSKHILKLLADLKWESHYSWISVDVVSLYSTIPHPKGARKMPWTQLLLTVLIIGSVTADQIFPKAGNIAPDITTPDTIELYEDFPVGKEILYITANDPENDTLTYGIEGDDAFHFKVNPNTGELQLAFPLDYELKDVLIVTLTVKDPYNRPANKLLLVIVKDCNDNDPFFQNTPYKAEIREDMAVGSIVCIVTAIDFDANRLLPVEYAIDEVIPTNSETLHLFYILSNGSIVLNGSLNYNTKSTFYQLKIRATDAEGIFNNSLIRRNATAYVSLDIEDLPDLNPQFLKELYSISIQENTPVGTSVIQVSAIDGDKGINDVITYSIKESSEPNLFNISSTTGEIYVYGNIDLEALKQEDGQIELKVEARENELNIKGENATSTASVTIRVLDVNDNKPQFYSCEMPNCDFKILSPTSHFVGEIEEHSSVRVPVSNLTIATNDPDKDVNGVFYLSLQGPDANYFTVSPSRVLNTASVQILVRDSSAIDYEKTPVMHIEILANDTGLHTDCCSIATVTINLININDETPIFNETSYKLTVLENCPNGTSLGIITATDKDAGEFGIVTYRLLPESIHNTFQVNKTTGEVIVVNGGLLDRERQSSYYATLQAQDIMNATGTTLLEIQVLDVNDETPKVTGQYFIFVEENTGDVNIKIEAFDADEPNTNNSRIQFRLLPGDLSSNFTVNESTGVITNIAPLDREAINEHSRGRIILTVELYDLGNPSLSSEVNITINVEDLNDNEPVFNQSVYYFSVTESTKGAYVGSLQATDGDQTEVNNRVSFRVAQGGSGNFLIRSRQLQVGTGQYIGELSLDPEVELDYEQQKSFTLIIDAQDNGLQGVTHITSATAIVQVLDLNDEPPYFVPSSLKDLYLLENSTADVQLLTTLQANDPDTDHDLEFQQLHVQCFKNEDDVGNICEDWLWLASNGELFVNNSKDVDYELCDLVVMLLRVEDKLTLLGDRYSKNVTQRVVIEDINDHAPEFSDIGEAFVVVPDIAPIDYQVAIVKASDKDRGQNAVLTFSIASVVFILSNGEGIRPLSPNIFKIITSAEKDFYLGSVRVASSLDVSLKGQYQVTVIAEDLGSPSLTSNHVLDIFAIDVSYRVSLYFAITADEVRDNSDEIKRALILATKATVYISAIDDAETARNVEPRATAKSIMSVYFVYSNGTAITPDELSRIIQSNQEALTELVGLGLYIIGGYKPTDSTKDDVLYGVIAGLAGVIILILLILIISLVCMRKSHKRKLRAVKALKMAKNVSTEIVQGGGPIPGTNKFNSDGLQNIDEDPGQSVKGDSPLTDSHRFTLINQVLSKADLL
ncbi:cadherin-related family member 2 [Bombina bombina]|uniref:cadherin-related family member 2 n=1 Tax=Bombina bombina TaxID=8345 RepID=UPI00235B2BBD|nr:cadherin-related family member 2 [Bombina bombina]